uniref:Uncharacterized protein n=1 Tax=Plectus sambesii TaxID=2011161 RepID=A0A914VDF0_9BILA
MGLRLFLILATITKALFLLLNDVHFSASAHSLTVDVDVFRDWLDEDHEDGIELVVEDYIDVELTHEMGSLSNDEKVNVASIVLSLAKRLRRFRTVSKTLIACKDDFIQLADEILELYRSNEKRMSLVDFISLLEQYMDLDDTASIFRNGEREQRSLDQIDDYILTLELTADKDSYELWNYYSDEHPIYTEQNTEQDDCSFASPVVLKHAMLVLPRCIQHIDLNATRSIKKCFPLLDCMAKQSLPVLRVHDTIGTDAELFLNNAVRQELTGITKEELEKNDIHHYGRFMRSGFDVLYSLCKTQAAATTAAQESLYEFGVFVAESLHASNCIVHRTQTIPVDLGLRRMFYEKKRKKIVSVTVEPGVSNTLEIYEVPEDDWPNSLNQEGNQPTDLHTLLAMFLHEYEEIASSETITGTFGRL